MAEKVGGTEGTDMGIGGGMFHPIPMAVTPMLISYQSIINPDSILGCHTIHPSVFFSSQIQKHNNKTTFSSK